MESPSNSSESTDPAFELTAEMMLDGEDVEGTLDEEELLDDDNEDEDELADLQKEGEMPLQDLLAMYYCNNQNEDTENVDPNEHTLNSANNLHEDEMQLSNEQMETDEFDPFHNQRVTRGLAAINSQFFDGDYSSDEEYQPTVDDWKKEIQIGADYQADVDRVLSEDRNNDEVHDDKLLWRPNMIGTEQLNRYLNIVYKLTDINSQTPDRDDEQALYTLLQMKSVDLALKKRQEQEKQPPDVSLWSEEECQSFEQGLRVFGKDFRLIQKNKVVTRSVGEIVQFYYLWKKTERHDAFVTQTKLGRKKYSIPGIADMMGRFLEENESVFSSRSASPNITTETSYSNDNYKTFYNSDVSTTHRIKMENLDSDSNEHEKKQENVLVKQVNHENIYYQGESAETYPYHYTSESYQSNFTNSAATSNTELLWRTSPNPITVSKTN